MLKDKAHKEEALRALYSDDSDEENSTENQSN